MTVSFTLSDEKIRKLTQKYLVKEVITEVVFSLNSIRTLAWIQKKNGVQYKFFGSMTISNILKVNILEY